MRVKKILISICLLSVIVSGVFAKSQVIHFNSDWKFHQGDNKDWSTPEFDFSNWNSVQIPGTLFPDDSKFFWIRSKIQVPPQFKNDDNIFIQFGGTTASFEVFADGNLIGRHGTIEPKASLCRVECVVVSIPGSAVKNGVVDVALRVKCNADCAVFEPFSFINQERFNKSKIYQNFLNSIVYYMMAAVCLFLGLYFLYQCRADKKDKASLSFSITLLTVAIYFYDMASPVLFMPFSIQLAISRACLLYSICFLVLFLRQFFKLSNKYLKYIVIGVIALYTILYAISVKSMTFQDTLFTLSLIPIFSGIIFIYIILVKAKKQKKKYAGLMLIGISVGMLFGVHDIAYQVSGVTPFAWLQGFAFFFIDLTMFIVVSMDTMYNKLTIGKLIEDTTSQKERLDEIIKNAVELSNETIEVAQYLTDSVSSVAEAAKNSADKAMEIGEFISLQNESVASTSNAVSNLVESVENIKNEVNNETIVVDSAVSETKNMVEGVNQVAVGIENAANFASSLGDLTNKTSEDVRKLVNEMNLINDASNEIKNIVKIVANFSQKTNMLAMNASIEAAHSGSAGTGFAVIAHEIKNLAASSATQVDKINEIVAAIGTHISQGLEFSISVNNALGKVANEAQGTAERVNESVQSLDIQRQAGVRITEASTAMSESAMRVKNETSQQYSYSKQVSENMKELSDYSSKASAAVNEIINRNQELSGQTQGLQKLAQRAKESAETMNKLINAN